MNTITIIKLTIEQSLESISSLNEEGDSNLNTTWDSEKNIENSKGTWEEKSKKILFKVSWMIEIISRSNIDLNLNN